MLHHVWMGLINCLIPHHLFTLFLGVFLGIWVGAIPGISGAIAIAILLPVTFFFTPDVAFVLMVGIYCGTLFGGSISAILFRVPGASTAAATVFDGYELTKKGQSAKALGTAIISSAIGGLFSAAVLIFTAPLIVDVVLAFGPAEYFSLIVFGLSVVGGLIAKSPLKGSIMVLLGLFLSTIGVDYTSGVRRLTFGTTALTSGLEFIPVMMGVFAAGEVFNFIISGIKKEMRVKSGLRAKVELPTGKEIRKLVPTWLRGSVIGTMIGALPGAGGTFASFLSYTVESRSSKHPEEFGKGAIEGVAAPEAANNASSGGALIPTLTLGIPGSEITALMLAGLTIHGLQAGPLLFIEQPRFIYTIFMALILANLIMFGMAFPITRVFTKLVISLPKAILYTIILAISLVGAYAIRFDMLDVWTVLIFGVFGYFMRRYRWPEAPLVLGMVLGPMLETNFRNALLYSNRDFTIFFTRPISATFLIIAIFSYMIPFIRSGLKKISQKSL